MNVNKQNGADEHFDSRHMNYGGNETTPSEYNYKPPNRPMIY